MSYSDEINTIFKKVFGVANEFFSTDESSELIQSRMEIAEKEGDQNTLQYQDHFNEVTFHHGLVFESAGIRFA